MNTKKLVPWISYLIFFSVINETVFNVATPKIAEQFSLGAAGVSWVMTSFMIFFGIGSVIYGKLADIYSLRSLIVFGIVLYAGSSFMGFLLHSSYIATIAMRSLQGLGASALPPLIFVVIARYFPAESRGKVFGTITAVVSFGIGIGPVIGGFVSGTFHWSLLFLIPLLTLIAIPFLRNILPTEPRKEGHVDILGALLVALTVGSIVLYLNTYLWYTAVAFVVFFAVLLFRMFHVQNPFIDPKLFKNKLFRNGIIVGFTLFSIVIGILFVIPLMLHDIHGIGTSTIGLVLFPGAISSIFFGPFGGRLADKRGNTFVVTLGLSLLVLSLVLIAFFMTFSYWIISACLLFLYVGFSLFQTALVNSVSQTLPVEQTGIGMGIFNLISVVSGALGTALVGKILDIRLLAFEIIGVGENVNAYAYSNIMLIFSAIVILGGVIYFRSYRNAPTTIQAAGH